MNLNSYLRDRLEAMHSKEYLSLCKGKWVVLKSCPLEKNSEELIESSTYILLGHNASLVGRFGQKAKLVMSQVEQDTIRNQTCFSNSIIIYYYYDLFICLPPLLFLLITQGGKYIQHTFLLFPPQ